MSNWQKNKKYEAYHIPGRTGEQSVPEAEPAAITDPAAQSDDVYYEINYESSPIPGVGKFVRKAQKIESPEQDEIREHFLQMRQISRENRLLSFIRTRFFDQNVQRENAKVFYKQGLFMKDFTDHYTKPVAYSSYYPNYQMMGYEQLRTYFTWRTEVRLGNVTDTPLSYAFLYLYELLNNIGVDSPQDGLTKLMTFWNAFRTFNDAIDRYMLRWLKDYHIYYPLSRPFRKFVEEHGLTAQYPSLADTEDCFALFSSISQYNIKKSVFYLDNHETLASDCFCHVIKVLRQVFSSNSIPFDEAIFRPTSKQSIWPPFKDALFFPWMKQPDRQVVLSPKELYVCRDNCWSFSTVITADSGRQLIGYIMKQMEAELRKATKYKHKLKPNLSSVTHEAIGQLSKAGLSLEHIISEAVKEFYQDATKIVVQVDQSNLINIRREAQDTQEKLSVPEQYDVEEAAPGAVEPPQPTDSSALSSASPWEELKSTLSEAEITALAILLDGQTDPKAYADSQGVMLEVLMDGINEKAMDCIGDNLMDEAFVLYDDYQEEVRELVKHNDK